MGATPASPNPPSKVERQLARLEGYHAVEQELARRRPARAGRPRFEDLSLAIPEDRRARLDRSDVDVSALDPDEHAYWRDGFLIKEGLIPDDLTERYWGERTAIDDRGFSAWGGSYMAMPSIARRVPLPATRVARGEAGG